MAASKRTIARPTWPAQREARLRQGPGPHVERLQRRIAQVERAAAALAQAGAERHVAHQTRPAIAQQITGLRNGLQFQVAAAYRAQHCAF